MVPPEQPSEGDENDVLSNLPRSRRQRPSARREQARAARDANGATPNGEGSSSGKSGTSSGAAAKKPAATRKPAAPAPEPGGHGERERPRKRVPAAGYATVREAGSYGNADPDELLKSFVRGILRRLPG